MERFRKVDGATVKRKVADGSVGNKVVVTDDVNRSESVEGKTFLSRWKRPRGSSPRKKDRARATVLAATRVLNVRGAHRFSDSAQVLVGEHFIESTNHPQSGWFDEGPSKGPPPCGRGLKPPEVLLLLVFFLFLLVADVVPNNGLV